ncbi:unnamed protein product [Polarella glacialis]|uniref:Homing endonuclease LAGLIDADG domain-containing protein n=1 Tax=Polarella glacialis TaxID=89957 RepID=A0A813M005_POLGL|nr:unnamed protein product [Polarella glacialis]
MSGCQMWVTQSSAHAESLLHFHSAFGGSIIVSDMGRGLQKPCIRWVVSGGRARSVAAALVQVSVVKETQLEVAASWPSCLSIRKEMAGSLKIMKREPQCSSRSTCSWDYLAGFFDAEGSIHVKARCAAIQLEVGQKFENVLKIIHSFLIQECPGTGIRIHQQTSFTRLIVSNRETCQFILRRLLSSGLSTKRPVALLALGVSMSNHSHSRAAIASLVGNQARYSRLDEEGIQRAKQITSIKSRQRKELSSGRLELVDQLHQQVETLKQDHALGNARARFGMLRHDIRWLLLRGAVQMGSLVTTSTAAPSNN